MQLFEDLLPKVPHYEIKVFKPWLYRVAKNHCLQILREENKEIPNICDNSKITSLKAECRKDKYSNVTSGYDFWEHREYLFPNLIFVIM